MLASTGRTKTYSILRQHKNWPKLFKAANVKKVLSFAVRVVSWDMGGEMAEKFLAGKWCEGFTEQRRLNNERGYEVLQEIEARHFK